MARNRYPGMCYRCGDLVAAGNGHFERNGFGWRVQHADCAIQWRGKVAPTKEAAKAWRYAHNPDIRKALAASEKARQK